MKTYALIFLVLATSTASAQMHLPPVEYDKPYTGKLTVEVVTLAQLYKQCTVATQWTLGCAFPGKDSCRIILLEDNFMSANGWTKEAMLRHETAHCNGWPGDHPGKRPYRTK